MLLCSNNPFRFLVITLPAACLLTAWPISLCAENSHAKKVLTFLAWLFSAHKEIGHAKKVLTFHSSYRDLGGIGTGIPGISILEVISHRPSLKREPVNETETKIKSIPKIRQPFLNICFLLSLLSNYDSLVKRPTSALYCMS